jgi:outer membrane immunogenic protein
MKRLVVGVAAALIVTAGPAAAEGLPPTGRIAAPVQVGPNWNGFYLGVGIGAGSLVAEESVYKQLCERDGYCEPWVPTEVVPVSNTEHGGDGIFGTVTVGFDRVIRPGWVAGVFADYDFGSTISSESSKFSVDHDYSWAVGGRLGFLVNPTTLIYGTAGYTQAQFSASKSGPHGFDTSSTFSGYFVWAGLETFLRQNWTLKLEYRYSDFGSETMDDIEYCWDKGTDLDPSTHTARLVLSYRFGHRAEAGSIKD